MGMGSGLADVTLNANFESFTTYFLFSILFKDVFHAADPYTLRLMLETCVNAYLNA